MQKRYVSNYFDNSSSGRYKLAEAGGRSESIIILAYLESQETE